MAGVDLFPGVYFWSSVFAGCLLTLVASVSKQMSIDELRRAAWHFPITFWSFVKALIRSTPKQIDFIHTPKEFMHDLGPNVCKDQLKG